MNTAQVTLSPATSWATCTSLRAYRSLEGFTGEGQAWKTYISEGSLGCLPSEAGLGSWRWEAGAHRSKDGSRYSASQPQALWPEDHLVVFRG